MQAGVPLAVRFNGKAFLDQGPTAFLDHGPQTTEDYRPQTTDYHLQSLCSCRWLRGSMVFVDTGNEGFQVPAFLSLLLQGLTTCTLAFRSTHLPPPSLATFGNSVPDMPTTFVEPYMTPDIRCCIRSGFVDDHFSGLRNCGSRLNLRNLSDSDPPYYTPLMRTVRWQTIGFYKTLNSSLTFSLLLISIFRHQLSPPNFVLGF